MYRSDSDESLRQYRLCQQQAPLRPQSTLSLNQLCFRRSSNPDIYPGARRFSTSYSHEDILSNDQLDQIHFDPRYRDYRSASSLNNSNYRSRSNSLNSCGSGGNLIHQYEQQKRRLSSHSPPLIGLPLAPQKRWDTNPSIFIEEYNDEDHLKSKTESLKSDSKSEKNSKETLCSSIESLQPLSECDIKSLGDLSQIPFIDEDSNDSAPCRFVDDDRKTCGGIMTSGSTQRNTCRKTVSFDVIAGEPSGHHHLFTNNGKNSPKNPQPNPYPTDKNQLFHGSHHRANVRPSRDGINRYSQSLSSVLNTSSASCDDHCTLVDKLIRMKLEENIKVVPCPMSMPKSMTNNNKRELIDDSRVCEGKVKALTSYFNSLPYMIDDCHCANVHHQSTPDLSISQNRNSLSHDEMEIVRKQLKEWSEFGLRKASDDKPVCSFFEHSSPLPSDPRCFQDCNQRVLNKLDERRKKLHHSLTNLSKMYNPMLPGCFLKHKAHHCHSKCHAEEDDDVKKNSIHAPPKIRSEKHKCRSPCYNIKDPAKNKTKEFKLLSKSSLDDDNESFVI